MKICVSVFKMLKSRGVQKTDKPTKLIQKFRFLMANFNALNRLNRTDIYIYVTLKSRSSL